MRSWIGEEGFTAGVSRCSLGMKDPTCKEAVSLGRFRQGGQDPATYSLAPYASAPLARAAFTPFLDFSDSDMALLGDQQLGCPVQLRLLNLELKFI